MSGRRSLSFIKNGAAVVVIGPPRDGATPTGRTKYNLAFVVDQGQGRSMYRAVKVRVDGDTIAVRPYQLYPFCPEVLEWVAANDAWREASQQMYDEETTRAAASRRGLRPTGIVGLPVNDRWAPVINDLGSKAQKAKEIMEDKLGGH